MSRLPYPPSNDRRFAVQTNPCCSGKMRRIDRLKSDIGREDQMLREAIFSRTIRVVTDSGINAALRAESSAVGIEPLHCDR